MPPTELVSQRISFFDLCTTFQTIKNSVSSAKRIAFDKFFRRWQSLAITHNPADGSYEFNTADSFYPAMRIFVPSQDDRSFGIKELRLNALVCKVLMVKPLEKCNSIPTDLLIERLVSKVEERFTNKKCQLSIYQVNESLDRLTDSQQRDEELHHLFSNCSAVELRWIMHVLVGDVERALGLVHSSTILNWLHKDADRMLRAGDPLRTVCEVLANASQDDENATAGALVGRNLLCKPFNPMLLKRLNYNKNCLPHIIKFCRRPFYMELKYDGEHILLHKFAQSAYKYFTRNGVDYTNKLGGDASTRLSAKVHPYFAAGVVDCVLDCELLIWDNGAKAFVGKNRRASDGKVYDAKHLDEDFFDNATFERSLVVFDVLYLNGRCLVDLPLHERNSILHERIFASPTESLEKSKIFVSDKKLVNTAQEFVDFYNQAMRNGEEGVVVKSLESTYKIGSRAERNGWFKIKPDYGVQSVLDLAVVAVRYENNSATKVQSFLVAAAEGEKSDMKFRIVAGITTHLKKMDFTRLMQLLRHDCGLLDSGPPDWIAPRSSNSSYSSSYSTQNASHNNQRNGIERNLRYVPRQNIQVVEVRASGLINGRLQFPSIVSIRTDKFVEDIDTVQDVRQFDERLRSRPMVDEEDAHEAILILNRKRRLNLKLKEDCKIVKKSEVEEVLSDALNGKKVCVLNANPPAVSVQELQKILISFGASIVANAGKTTDFVVAINPKHIKCAAAIKANLWHIVSGDWLVRCRDASKLLPWKESDMLHKSPTAVFDLFKSGDGGSGGVQSESNTENGLETAEEWCVDTPSNNSTPAKATDTKRLRHAEEIVGSPEAICAGPSGIGSPIGATTTTETDGEEAVELAGEEDCAPAVGGNLFSDFVFFLHSSVRKLPVKTRDLSAKICAQNGAVASSLGADVTHVIVDIINSDEADELFAWNEKLKSWNGVFVSLEWVDESIEAESRYLPTENLMRFLLF